MAEDIRAIRERDWQILYERVKATLDRFGQINAFGDGDYWLVDDDWGWFRQQVEFHTLKMLRPEVIDELQNIIANYPDWEITVRIDLFDRLGKWPGMGLFVRSDEIIDELRRDVLPPEFSGMTFARSKQPRQWES